MRTFSNRKETDRILRDLEQRFLHNERLSVKTIISEYMKPRNELQYMQAERRVRSWIPLLKRRFSFAGIDTFGCLNADGEYGLAETQAEARYVINDRFTFQKGIFNNITKFTKAAIAGNILPASNVSGESLKIPSVVKGEANE